MHFGHQTRRWNPKMRRFIHGERGGIYIIDLLKTEQLLAQAQRFASEVAHRGGTVLFVGTKKQARDGIKDIAESAGMPYVNHRWLGGLLTNFQTISLRIKRLHDLERYADRGPARAAADARAAVRRGRPREAAGQPGRRQEHAARARRDVRGRPQDRGDRRPRGAAPADPDHRAGRHELRSRRDRLRRAGQRRRHPLLRADHAGDRRRRRPRAAAASAPRRSAPARRPRSRRAARPRSVPAARPRSRRAARPRSAPPPRR